MIVAPVIERELRVAARNPATYRLRVIFVGGLVSVASLLMLVGSVNPPGSTGGRVIFNVLSVLLLAMCLLEGARSTAESISKERRQGTLGLLFLTNLTGADVVLGKLVALGLRPFYGLLAVIPILSMALLMGGVSGSELGRTAIVLIANLIFSLCLGVGVSAVTPSGRSSFSWVIFGLTVVCAGPFAVGGTLSLTGSSSAGDYVYALSPLYSFLTRTDLIYRANPERFWISVGMGAFWSVCCFMVAAWVTPKSIYGAGEFLSHSLLFKPLTVFLGRKPASTKCGVQTKKWTPITDDQNPAVKLFDRPWVTRRLFIGTVVVALLFGGFAAYWLAWGLPGEVPALVGFGTAALLGLGTRIGLASQVAHDTAAVTQDKHWELLATTPLTRSMVLSGLAVATIRLWLMPVIIQIAILFAGWIFLLSSPGNRLQGMGTWTLLASGPIEAGVFLLDLFTIGSFAAWSALATGKPANAAIRAIVFTQLLPSLFCCWGLLRFLTDQFFLVFALRRLFGNWNAILEKRGT